MTFGEYVLMAHDTQRKHPEWRWGQTLFNVLYGECEDLAEEVRGSALDPFHSRGTKNDDPTIGRFLAFVRERLEGSK